MIDTGARRAPGYPSKEKYGQIENIFYGVGFGYLSDVVTFF